LKITRAKGLFSLLLFLSLTILPIKIEEIIDDDYSSENNTNINKKSSKVLFKSYFRPTSNKTRKKSRRTKTEPPARRVIDTPQTTYFFYQNTQIDGLNSLSNLLRTIFSKKYMPNLYNNDNVPLATSTNQNHLNITKLPLRNKTSTNQSNKHSNTQSIPHRLEVMNRSLTKSWGPPLF